MLPMKALRLKFGELLAADATTLAPAADNNVIALIKEDFNLNETLAVGDLVLADFTGSTPLECGLGTQPVGIDPLTGEQVITLEDPAGGWRWECTADPAEPQPIYGYALLTDGLAVLLGAAKLPDIITISESGHELTIGSVQIRMVTQPAS